MAIVLKYGSPGTLAEAGFASGVGHRQQAQTDDALKIWQQQQYQAFHAQQDAAERQQRAALLKQTQNFQADQQTAQNYFHDKSQLGQQNFQAAQSELSRQQQQKHFDDIKYQGIQKAIADGTMVLPPSAQKELDKIKEGRVLMQGPGWFPEQTAQFEKDAAARERALAMLAEPRKQISRDAALRNHFGDAYESEKGKPYYIDSQGEPKLPAGYKDPIEQQQKQAEAQQKQQLVAQAAQQKQQQAAAAAAQKQAEKFQADTKEYGKTLHAEMVRRHTNYQQPSEDVKAGKEPPPLESYAEEAKKGLEAAGIVPPQQTQAQSPQPVQGQAETGRWGDGQHGEPVTGEVQGPTTPAGTFSGLPAVNQPGTFNGQPVQIERGPFIEGTPIQMERGPFVHGTPVEIQKLAMYQKEQAAKARAMGIPGSMADKPQGEGEKYTDPSGKVYQLVNGMWKRIQ